jgi:hypothetical protein
MTLGNAREISERLADWFHFRRRGGRVGTEMSHTVPGSLAHITEEDLERYSMHAMTEEESGRVEEHLLTCTPCQTQLDETEVFIGAMRNAARQYREQESRPKTWLGLHPRALAACAACLAILFVAIAVRSSRKTAGTHPMAVLLESNRAAVATVAAPGTPVVLRPEMNGLPTFDRYGLEVVNAAGENVWKGNVRWEGQVSLPGLKAGVYYVRILAPTGQPLREYGLQVAAAR